MTQESFPSNSMQLSGEMSHISKERIVSTNHFDYAHFGMAMVAETFWEPPVADSLI